MRTTTNPLAESAVRALSTPPLLRICALHVAMCASLSTLVLPQGATARRDARATRHRSNTMTELHIVDAPRQVRAPGTATADTAIRPFRVQVSAEALTDLRRRLQATRWPDKETVTDQSQGAQLARLQALVQYWGGGYDWRKAEATLNALPQSTTNIDGLDIHFIQVKSKEKNALPVLITHGWPGSVFEFLGAIGPLTDPAAHGVTAVEAFD